MKSLNKRIVLVSISSLIGIMSFSIKPPKVMAQQEICRDAYIKASDKIRTVELPQFGIDLNIPANYRAIVFDGDHVGIMNPGAWELYSCIERGGEVLFPRGGFGFNIYKIDYSTPQAALEAQKQGRYNTSGTVYKYYINETEVLIDVINNGFSTIKAYFAPPSIDKVVRMELTCDCSLDVEDIVKELDQTRLRD